MRRIWNTISRRNYDINNHWIIKSNKERKVVNSISIVFFFQKEGSEGRKSGTKRLTYQEHRFHRCSAKITSKNNINPWSDALFIRDAQHGDSLSLYLPDTSHIYTWKRLSPRGDVRRGKKEKKKRKRKGGHVNEVRFA